MSIPTELDLGNKYKSEKKYDLAILTYEKILIKASTHLEAMFNLAECLLLTNRIQESLKLFDRLIIIDKLDDRHYNGKAKCMRESGGFSEAIRFHNKALEINRNNHLTYYDLGITYSKFRKFDEAISKFNITIDLKPLFTPAYSSKAICLLEIKKYKECLECCNSELDIDPNSEKANMNKGYALFYLKRYDEATKCFNSEIELNSRSATAYNLKGKSLFELNKYNEALECFNKELTLNSKSEKVHNHIGKCLYEMGNYEKALIYFDKEILLNNQSQFAYLNKGKCLYKLRKFLDAIDSLKRQLQIFSCSEAYLYMSKAYFNLKFYQESIDCSKQEINLNAKSELANINIAICFYKLKNYEDSIDYCNKQLINFPDNIEALMHKAKSLYQLFNIKDALICLDRALILNSNDTDIINLRAEYLKELERNNNNPAIFKNKTVIEIDLNYSNETSNNIPNQTITQNNITYKNRENQNKSFLDCIQQNVLTYKKIDKKDLTFLKENGKLKVLRKNVNEIVYLGEYCYNRVEIAKFIFTGDESEIKRHRDRLSLMSLINHHNLQRVYAWAEDEEALYTVSEVIEVENLFNICITELSDKINFITQIVTTLYYLHSFNPSILHGDITPHNFLITKSKKIYIINYGVIKNETLNHNNDKSLVYMAPELFNNHIYTKESEIYSIGLLMWTIIYQNDLYSDLTEFKNHKSFIEKIRKELKPNTNNTNINCPKVLLELISKCLEEDLFKRPTLKEICDVITQIKL